MNVLILTPDRVGSTLLQRVLTIYMLTCKLNKPVINLHELSNGLDYYYSDVFNQFVLGKEKWGYHQSLNEIIELLDKADHYKTSRLAHYHLIRRNDSIADQTLLYKYLNDNFYIIACQRKNVFEYALSWGIYSITKQLNVYNHADKISMYSNLYKDKITIPPQEFIKSLDAYRDYVEWTKVYFNVNSFYIYEDHAMNIEQYISELGIFGSDNKPDKWESMFGLSWDKWNRCHKLVSDLTFSDNKLLLDSSLEKNTTTIRNIASTLPAPDQQFLHNHSKEYVSSLLSITELVNQKILTTGVPIKLQTLLEKKMMVKNFDELVDVYNNWADENNYPLLDSKELVDSAFNELKNWYVNPLPNLLIT